MFQLGSAEVLLRLEHRHNDGSWSELDARPSAHDPAALDPERGWANGQIFQCKRCDEQVRVIDPASQGGPAKP